MAVTKLKSADFKTLPVGSLLDIREAAQATLATADPKSADYKNARANLTNINKEIGRDLGIGSNAAKLDDTQIANVSNARNNFQSTVTLEGVPANVQKSVNNALNKNIATAEKQVSAVISDARYDLNLQLKADNVSPTVRAQTLAAFDQVANADRATLRQPGFQGESLLGIQESGHYLPTLNVAGAEATIAALNNGLQFAEDYGFNAHARTGDHSSTGLFLSQLNTLANAAQDGVVNPNELRSADGLVGFKNTTRAANIYEAVAPLRQTLVDPQTGQEVSVPVGVDASQIDNLKDLGNGQFTGKARTAEGSTLTSTFIRGQDGKYYNVANVNDIVNTNAGLGPLGSLALGIAGGFLVGPLASNIIGPALGTGTIASTAIAGGLIGAGTAALTGQNILTGGLLGAAGGAFGGYVGQAGGLGNVINRAGFTLPPSVTRALNTLVSGIGTPSADDLAQASQVLDDVGYPAGSSILDEIAAESGTVYRAGQNIRGGIMNQANPNVVTNVPGTGFTATNPPTTFGGYGLTSPNPAIASAVEEAFRNVAFANADEVRQAALNAARAAGQNISLTMPGGEFVLTATPGGTTVQTPFNEFSQTGPQFAPIDEVGPGRPGTTQQNPNISAGEAIPGLIDAATDAVTSGLGVGGTLAAISAINAINREPVSTGVGDNKLPAWALDPAMSAVIPRIQAAQAAMPAPMPNLFNAQFQRGGLGAGQFIGYDLLNRTGDIPQQTLLGVSPLAMPPMNLLGVTGGQTPTSQTALV